MSAYDQLAVRLGPAGYWPLDDVTGARDASGNYRHGSPTGTLTRRAAMGMSAGGLGTAFGGGSVEMTYSPFSNSNVLTLCGWARRADTAARHTLFGSAGASGDYVRFSAPQGDSDAELIVASNTTDVTWADAFPNRLFFWALTLDAAGDSAELYVDGRSLGSQSMTRAYDATPGALKIGARGTGSFDPFMGEQACFAVYERELAAGEIMSLYRTGATGLGGPLL